MLTAAGLSFLIVAVMLAPNLSKLTRDKAAALCFMAGCASIVAHIIGG